MLPIAHAGHWFEGALYLAPVLILVIVLFVQGRKTEDDEATLVEGGLPESGESEPTRDAHTRV
jgi:hypothetical protein